MTLLLDVTGCCPAHTDEVLELLHKAEPPEDGGIWDLHPSPLVRQLVELFTQRGLVRVEGVRQELNAWLAGARYREGLERVARPAGAMQAWSAGELAVVKLYLESLPTADFALDDWLLTVDYIVHRYLGESDLRTEADWLSSRAAIMGRVQAALQGREATVEEADTIMAALATASGQRRAQAGLTADQRAVLDFGRARCAENVVGLSDAIRHRMRRLLVDRQEGEFLGDRARTAEAAQTQLVDAFGAMNRDWRRIAVTEATENLNQGLVASLVPGTRVKRVEKYRGACPFCRSIDGRIMDVVDPAAPDKDGERQVWVGKTNLGRSAAPRKRVGSILVDRLPKEMWWVAAGTMHPHCRGMWIVLEAGTLPVDPAFSDWMDTVLGRK